MNLISFTLVLLMGQSVNITPGFGGLYWDVNRGTYIDSNTALSVGATKSLHKNWSIGSSFTFNAYSSDEVYHTGPGMIFIDAFLYRKFKIDEWRLLIGVGTGISWLFSSRYFADPTDGYSSGRYNYNSFGISGGLHSVMKYPLTDRIFVGFSMKYFSGIYTNPCWKGPENICDESDYFRQHWVVGLMFGFRLK